MLETRDIAFMRAALALARRGLGRTAPMPSVAALVVDESRDPPVVLGRGLTAPGGRPHAEANALDQAGAAARGATIYVTLEPCARRSERVYGPSCTERILEAGIARVVIGAADPSPFAAGEGSARLRAAGITVVDGVLGAEAGELNRGHCQRVRLNRPFTRLKLAQTADGFAASANRQPLAITGEEARAHVHRMRAGVDALITGIDTILADDPLLDVRLPGMADWSPLRVILDTNGRIARDARILADAARVPVLIATALPEAVLARIGDIAGVEVIAIPKAGAHLDLAAVMGALAARGITRVLIEAGPMLADAFAAAGLADEVVLLTGPQSAGQGLPAVRPALAQWIQAAHLAETRQLGADIMYVYVGNG
jgi:diaminohydroxyphosphoribosylaminopyrimidine deaminase/5-amino-6-(5-phosphoribosylamino)uracil reductase